MMFIPTGQVVPCCNTSYYTPYGNVKDNTLEEIWNNDAMRKLRQELMTGVKPSSCQTCFQHEAMGGKSQRQSFNEEFKHHIPLVLDTTTEDGYNNDFKLVYWDLRFTNLCNLKCRMCDHKASSTWFDEQHINSRHYDDRRVIHVDDFSKKPIKDYIEKTIHQVERVYFAGGEPLLMDEHYYILDRLIEEGRTDVKLVYNTNLSRLVNKDRDVLEYWKQFKHVSVCASVDGVGEVGSYIRSGIHWKTFQENMKRVTDYNASMVAFNITAQIFNVLDLPNIVDFALANKVSANSLMINTLNTPVYYSIDLLPKHLKEHVAQVLNKHLTTLSIEDRNIIEPKYNTVINYMNVEPSEIDTNFRRGALKMVTLQLDKSRNESYRNRLHPILVDWLDQVEQIDEKETYE